MRRNKFASETIGFTETTRSLGAPEPQIPDLSRDYKTSRRTFFSDSDRLPSTGFYLFYIQDKIIIQTVPNQDKIILQIVSNMLFSI